MNDSSIAFSSDGRLPPRRRRVLPAGAAKLAVVSTIILFVWCIVLPWYGHLPTMEKHLQFLDDRGIDPSAMFYTELDAMDAILEKIEND